MSTSSTNTLGKYQIIREIARSNDIVYEALDPTINRRIALKELCIPTGLQGQQRRERIERFWREGRAAGKLTHPNIVTIYEVGKDGDRHFIAMEYLEGQTLRDRLQVGGAMQISDVKNYTLQLCSALSYAHQNGVVHRDVKPENVQILPGSIVKLTDFGIARLMGEPSITQDGQVFGTPSYMSPEQVAGKPIDARSDIFSLGVLIYEMAAGHKPFQGDSVVTITYNIMNMEPPAPPGAPPYLVGIIRKAMAKDPDNRYATIEDLVRDMQDERSSDAHSDGARLQVAPHQGAGTSFPSPFGATFAPQPNQPMQQYPPPQPQGPVTPYGTPFPSASAGSVPMSSPDPFSPNASLPAPLMLPPGAPRTVMSSETRNFLGILLFIIGLVGMLVFAIWAVNLAYTNYQTAMTKQVASRYYAQGRKLYERGDTAAAVRQWQNAIRVSPKSKEAGSAREMIYGVSVKMARDAYDARNFALVQQQAETLIEARPERPEGHFYLALAYQCAGDVEKAKQEYIAAIQRGGSDDYASASRKSIGWLCLTEGDRQVAAGRVDEATASYEDAKKYGDTDSMQAAEERISSLRYSH